MATITGYTAEHMEEIKNMVVVDGEIVGDDLILKRFDDTEINAGNVRGATGSPGISEEDFLEQIDWAIPIGGIIDYPSINPPTNWIACVGQTVINAQSLYPTLWSRIPAAMKSGTSMIMPDTRGRVVVGLHTSDAQFDTILETGGAKTHTLITAELPIHAHAIDHNHASQNTGNQSAQHQHPIDHNHAAFTSSAGSPHSHAQGDLSTGVQIGTHTHASGNGQQFATADGVVSGHDIGAQDAHSVPGVTASTGTEFGTHVHNVFGTTSPESAHTHPIDVPLYAGLSGVEPDVHHHVVDINPFTGSSGNAGSGSAHNNLQPYIVFLKIMRAA